MHAILEMAHTVREVLASPRAIFRGIRWDGYEDKDPANSVDSWLCYSKIPKMAFFDAVPKSPPLGEVFLVFVNSENVVYHWQWEDADPTDPNLPMEHVVRFRERVI